MRTTAAKAKVLVVARNVDDARLVAELLHEDFDEVGTSSDLTLSVRDFEHFRPQVLVLSFKTLEESERYYLRLYRLGTLVHGIGHRTVVLCNRVDSYRAYELCRKRQFDDYVVFWPATHDPQRLLMAVLLAARAGVADALARPGPLELTVQARRIAELEALLQRSLAQGSARIEQLGDSLRRVEADVEHALDGLSAQMVRDGGHAGVIQIGDRAAFEREFNRLRDEHLRAPFESIGSLLEPVQDWIESFAEELAPQLQTARALAEHIAQVRPRILIVDDDEFQHRLLQQMLVDVPVELDFASSGTEALAQLRTRRPDLILMDFRLPDVTGVEVVRRLKLVPTTAVIPVILITGTSTREVLFESHQAGAVDFMVKPFDRDRLIAGIGRHVQL